MFLFSQSAPGGVNRIVESDAHHRCASSSSSWQKLNNLARMVGPKEVCVGGSMARKHLRCRVMHRRLLLTMEYTKFSHRHWKIVDQTKREKKSRETILAGCAWIFETPLSLSERKEWGNRGNWLFFPGRTLWTNLVHKYSHCNRQGLVFNGSDSADTFLSCFCLLHRSRPWGRKVVKMINSLHGRESWGLWKEHIGWQKVAVDHWRGRWRF